MTIDRRLVPSAFVSLAVLMAITLSCNQEPQMQAISLPDALTPQDSTALETQIAQFAGPWHDAPCTGCQAQGEVQIRAVGQTKDIKANDGPPRRLVGQIKNTSSEDVIHGPSGFVFKAHHMYLLFVSRADSPATNAQWGMTVFGIGYDPNYVIGPLQACGDPVTVPKIDDAAFYDCGDRHASVKPRSLVKTAYAGERLPVAATIPKRAWISCDPDCCTGAGSVAVGPVVGP